MLPLSKGTNKKTINKNIQKLVNEGYGYKAAYAISYKKAGKYKPK